MRDGVPQCLWLRCPLVLCILRPSQVAPRQNTMTDGTDMLTTDIRATTWYRISQMPSTPLSLNMISDSGTLPRLCWMSPSSASFSAAANPSLVVCSPERHACRASQEGTSGAPIYANPRPSPPCVQYSAVQHPRAGEKKREKARKKQKKGASLPVTNLAGGMRTRHKRQPNNLSPPQPCKQDTLAADLFLRTVELPLFCYTAAASDKRGASRLPSPPPL